MSVLRCLVHVQAPGALLRHIGRSEREQIRQALVMTEQLWPVLDETLPPDPAARPTREAFQRVFASGCTHLLAVHLWQAPDPRLHHDALHCELTLFEPTVGKVAKHEGVLPLASGHTAAMAVGPLVRMVSAEFASADRYPRLLPRRGVVGGERAPREQEPLASLRVLRAMAMLYGDTERAEWFDRRIADLDPEDAHKLAPFVVGDRVLVARNDPWSIPGVVIGAHDGVFDVLLLHGGCETVDAGVLSWLEPALAAERAVQVPSRSGWRWTTVRHFDGTEVVQIGGGSEAVPLYAVRVPTAGVLVDEEHRRVLSLVAGARYSIGSAPSCNLRLDDATVLPVHATIEASSGEARLKSARWFSRIRINDLRRWTSRVGVGDVVRIGKSQLRFVRNTHDVATPEADPGVRLDSEHNRLEIEIVFVGREGSGAKRSLRVLRSQVGASEQGVVAGEVGRVSLERAALGLGQLRGFDVWVHMVAIEGGTSDAIAPHLETCRGVVFVCGASDDPYSAHAELRLVERAVIEAGCLPDELIRWCQVACSGSRDPIAVGKMVSILGLGPEARVFFTDPEAGTGLLELVNAITRSVLAGFAPERDPDQG